MKRRQEEVAVWRGELARREEVAVWRGALARREEVVMLSEEPARRREDVVLWRREPMRGPGMGRRKSFPAMCRGGFFLVLVVAMLFPWAGKVVAQGGGQYWDFPPMAPPHEYGDIVMDRVSSAAGRKPVYFSHWSHRRTAACLVCHFELGFEMEKGQTEIVEEDLGNGLYCGACHDGKTAFGNTEKTCANCHRKRPSGWKKKFKKFAKPFPKTGYGNRIDWVEATEKLDPPFSLSGDKPMAFDKRLDLAAEWAMVPPAMFPHVPHVRLLDCSNCHPDIFNIKKKSTKHFEMRFILAGKFCGVCHGKVAFPVQDCKRCHPKMRGSRH